MAKRPLARKAKAATSRKAEPAPLGVYANHVLAQWGAAEITITLGQTRAHGADWPVVEVGRYSLPIAAAKLLAFSLLTEITAHEAVLGPVNVSPLITPPMPVSAVFAPETIARLAILHAELFAPMPSPDRPEKTDVSTAVTKH